MKNAIMINVDKNMLPVYRESLLADVRDFKGVSHAEIIYRLNYWLNVVYDTKSLTSDKILKRVRRLDKNAIIN